MDRNAPYNSTEKVERRAALASKVMESTAMRRVPARLAQAMACGLHPQLERKGRTGDLDMRFTDESGKRLGHDEATLARITE